MEDKKIYMKKWRESNREKIKEYYKEWVENNKEHVKNYQKEYYEKSDKEKLKKDRNKWYHNNKENYKDKFKEYREKVSEHQKEYQKEYYDKNRDKLNSNSRKYYRDNIEKIKERVKNTTKDRLKNDPLFKLKYSIKRTIKNGIKRKNFKKKSQTIEILGCSFDEFKIYLESKFEPWMSWDNYGKYNGEFQHGWDIDHVIPLNEAKNEDDVVKLCHYKNLQPLCSKENRVLKRTKTNYKNSKV